MATPDGSTSEHLTFLRAAAQAARRFGVFALLRRAESRAKALPRIGESRMPAQNVVDLAQVPTLAFPDTTLDSIEVEAGRARVNGYWLGLTGPMGALPLHLSEFAYYERRYSKTRPFGRFLDLISGRSLQFFYRAWADSSPAASADRPEDPFSRYVGALTGSAHGVPADAAFSAKARLHYAGLYVGRRSAAALQDALCDLTGAPVRVHEFIPQLREIAVEDQTRLGRGLNQLGLDAVAGRRYATVSGAFRVEIQMGSFREYESFLPGGRRFRVVSEAVRSFAPSHLDWDLQLGVEAKELRPAALDGRSRLGWTSWMTPDPQGAPRADARLGRGARRIARQTGNRGVA